MLRRAIDEASRYMREHPEKRALYRSRELGHLQPVTKGLCMRCPVGSPLAGIARRDDLVAGRRWLVANGGQLHTDCDAASDFCELFVVQLFAAIGNRKALVTSKLSRSTSREFPLFMSESTDCRNDWANSLVSAKVLVRRAGGSSR